MTNDNGGLSDSDLTKALSIELSAKDQQIGELQDQLLTERNDRRFERFVFVLALTASIDVIVFGQDLPWAAYGFVIFIELIIFYILAIRWDINEIVPVLRDVLIRASKKIG